MYICISWRQHDEIMMMMSALHQTNTLSWIFIVLVHWNNSLQVDLSLQTDILFWFQGNQVDLSLQTDIHFVLFWFWANQVDLSLQTDILFWFWANQVDLSLQTDILFWFWANQLLFLLLSVECREATNANCIIFGLIWLWLKHTIYHTQGKHTNHYTTNAAKFGLYYGV